MPYAFNDWHNHHWKVDISYVSDVGIDDGIVFTFDGAKPAVTKLSDVACGHGSHSGGDWEAMECGGPYKGSSQMASGRSKTSLTNIQIESSLNKDGVEQLVCKERDVGGGGGVCWTAVEGG